MDKRITLDAALGMIRDGMTLMVGGFLGCGGATRILEALARTGVRDLTLISNDTAYADKAQGLLVAGGQVRRLIVTHIGTNPVTGVKMNTGEIEVEFVPQGTLAERIRAAGAGLGGVLTPTGLGTIVAEGKRTVEVDGKEYLLELPLHADMALLGATIADEAGNLFYRGTTQNFNPVMATAADVVIAEAEQIVPVGGIEPEAVHTPALYVDYIYLRD